MINDALFYNPYEIIGGEKIMASSTGAYHNNIMGGLYTLISFYVRNNKLGYVFTDSLDVHLLDGNLLKPDLIVVKKENAAIINWQRGIYGVPDMVVEVLSRSTRQNDLTLKKDIYETNGVKEYWIIDPYMKAVDVYILRNGKFELDGEYFKYNADEWSPLDEEKLVVKPEIKVSIFDNLFVKVDDIFSWGYDD